MIGCFVDKRLQLKQNIGMVILHHQKKLESVILSDRPAIVETDLLLYCSKQREANWRPLHKPLSNKHIFLLIHSQTNGLLHLHHFIYTETTPFARKSKPHHYRSKISRADSTPVTQARGPIFCMVTLGTHRYYQNNLQPDPSTFGF